MTKVFTTALCVICFLMFFERDAFTARTHYVTIGTGGITGTYYPTGTAIARIANRKRREHGIRVSAEATGGSVFNINALISGDIEFGFARADILYEAYAGLAQWREKGSQADLRTVFSITTNTVTLLAGVDSGIKDMEDLRGKRVNIGNPGSSINSIAKDALRLANIDYKDIIIEDVKSYDAFGLLHDRKIDALFYLTIHPNGRVKEALRGRRQIRFIEISVAREIIKQYRYYCEAVIPVHEWYPYAFNRGNVKTFGVKTVLVTSRRVPDSIVYVITKEIFENFDSFKKLHPALMNLESGGMLEGLPVRLHSGAMKYYEEKGLM